MNQNNFIRLLSAVLLLSGSFSARALESDRKQPIAIEADQGSLDQKNQTTVFSGNVLIRQGSLNIQAQSVRVSQDKNGNQTMSAQGNPVRFGQQLENKGYVEGQGNRVEYSSLTNVVRLNGNAQIKRGGDVVKGESISYNTRTETYEVRGNKSGKRISVVIQPTEKQ